MSDTPSLIAVCCAAVLISGCKAGQDEFEVAALTNLATQSSIQQASESPVTSTEALSFSESSLKAAELGLPFPKIAPRASSQSALVGASDLPEQSVSASLAASKDVPAASLVAAETAHDDSPVVVADVASPSEKADSLQSQNKPKLAAATTALVSAVPGAAVFPTIDEILNTAKKGVDLNSYNSFLKTRSGVDTSCFPPELIRILSLVHKKYGTKPSVSSGFRSASYNRRIGGARGSYHTKCLAADIKVAGVNKYTLAKYLRTIPDIGGVGVYGCRGIVHVDVGPRRNWHRPCRKRRRA